MKNIVTTPFGKDEGQDLVEYTTTSAAMTIANGGGVQRMHPECSQ
jgi:hypothetical protein